MRTKASGSEGSSVRGNERESDRAMSAGRMHAPVLEQWIEWTINYIYRRTHRRIFALNVKTANSNSICHSKGHRSIV